MYTEHMKGVRTRMVYPVPKNVCAQSIQCLKGYRESKESPGERSGPKILQLINYCSRRGNYTCIEVIFYTNNPLLKAVLITLPKLSFSQKMQWKWKKKK